MEGTTVGRSFVSTSRIHLITLIFQLEFLTFLNPRVLEKSAKEASQQPKVKSRDYRSEVIESYCQRRAEIQELGMKIEASSSQPELASQESPALDLENYPAKIGRSNIYIHIKLEEPFS